MIMDNSVFPETCRNSHKDMLDHHDLIEKFSSFDIFCSETEDLDILQNNSPRCTDRNDA
jgi:hypothetical protein